MKESLEEFRSRIGARLDAHFTKFAPAVSAINAGFAAHPVHHRATNERTTMTDKNRIDMSEPGKELRNVHLRGFYGGGGENEGVLAVAAELSTGMFYPNSGRIIIGSPSESPLIEGYIPNLGGFSCGPDAAEQLAAELIAAAAAVRAATAVER